MKAKILIIDDEVMLRNSLCSYLEDSGYVVHEAESGEEGVELALSEAPELVICDLRMPDMDGIDVIKAIRSKIPSLPVIVVSGAGVMDDVVQALRLGANDYILKPILDMAVLEHSIEKNLKQARLEIENQQYKENLEKMNKELSLGLHELHLDQQAGKQLQKKMLPEAMSVAEYSFEHFMKPSLYLSGDFLDYFTIHEKGVDEDHPDYERYVVFYIADVSGHGSSSAIVTALLKNFTYRLRRNIKRGSSDELFYPDKVLAKLNSELLETGIEKHLTVFYSVLDRKESRLHYSVGAHYPMPVLLQDGSAQFLSGEGMPIGLFQEVDCKTYSIELSESFSLVLFSDGIFEVLGQGSLNEKELQVLKLVELADGDLEQLKDKFDLANINDIPDDIAILTVTRN